MSRTITIDLRDFAGAVAGEVVGGEDHVTVWAPTFRPAVTGSWVVGPQPKTFYFTDGKATIAGVEPGPIVVQFHVRQFAGEDTFNLNVPAGEGEIDLRTLMVEDYEYSPIVMTEAQRVLREAQDVLATAQVTRDSLTPAVAAAKRDVDSAVSGARSAIAQAQASLDTKVAQASKQLSDDAAKNLAAAKAAVEKVVADNKATLDSQVAAATTARTHAEARAADAETHRKAAEDASARAATAAVTVEGALSTKANSSHTHSIANVTGLQLALDGKANSSHTHTSAQVTNTVYEVGSSTAASKVVKTSASGWIFATADPPSDNALSRKKYVDDRVASTSTAAAGVKSLSSENLNDVTAYAKCIQAANVQATTERNYPVALAGLLEVTLSGAFVYQRYTTYQSDPRVFIRSRYKNNWSAWRELRTTTQKIPATDIDLRTNRFGTTANAEKVLHLNSTGWVFIDSDPTAVAHPARKGYVDGVVAAAEQQALADAVGAAGGVDITGRVVDEFVANKTAVRAATDGNYSSRSMYYQGAGAQKGAYLSQKFPCQPGAEIEVEFYVKPSVQLAANTVACYVRAYAADGTSSRVVSIPSNVPNSVVLKANVWTKVVGRVRMPGNKFFFDVGYFIQAAVASSVTVGFSLLRVRQVPAVLSNSATRADMKQLVLGDGEVVLYRFGPIIFAKCDTRTANSFQFEVPDSSFIPADADTNPQYMSIFSTSGEAGYAYFYAGRFYLSNLLQGVGIVLA